MNPLPQRFAAAGQQLASALSNLSLGSTPSVIAVPPPSSPSVAECVITMHPSLSLAEQLAVSQGVAAGVPVGMVERQGEGSSAQKNADELANEWIEKKLTRMKIPSGSSFSQDIITLSPELHVVRENVRVLTFEFYPRYKDPYLTTSRLTQIARLFPHIEKLQFDRLDDENVDVLETLQNFRRLNSLTFKFTSFDEASEKRAMLCLQRLPLLELVFDNFIGTGEHFNVLPHTLQKISCTSPCLEATAVLGFQNLRQLKELTIRGQGLTGSNFNLLPASLEKLHVEEAFISSVVNGVAANDPWAIHPCDEETIGGLEDEQFVETIKEESLDAQNKAQFEPYLTWEAIKGIHHLRNLKELHISGPYIGFYTR